MKDYGEFIVVERFKGEVTGTITVRADDDIAALLKAREELREQPTYEVKESRKI